MATSLPASYTVSPGVYTIVKDGSFVSSSVNPHKIAIVGFFSKGPINIPTEVTSLRNLYQTFGFPHPDNGDPQGIYAAELALKAATTVIIVRVAVVDPVNDELAATAEIEIPSSGGRVAVESGTAGDYVFSTDQYFRWRLNQVLASKKLVAVAATYTADELSDELNDQLAADDGIEFYVNDDDEISVRSTFSYGTDSSIEFVSVQSQMYGPSSVTGLGTTMTKAIITGTATKYPNNGYTSAGTYDFTALTDLNLQVVVDGTDNVNIDNVVQVIDFADLENEENILSAIVTLINDQIDDGVIPGGFVASASSNSLRFTSLHSGRDAKILVKSASTADAIFGFANTTTAGTSPSGTTGDSGLYAKALIYGSANSTDDVAFTLTADSAGTEGNYTSVVITTSDTTGTFAMQVFNNGQPVESFGNLTKDSSSTFYVESYLASQASFIRVVDNEDVTALPAPGTYTLVGGTDGIPSDAEDQDILIAGSAVAMTGLQSLSSKEDIDIDLVAVPGHSSTTVATAIINLCESRDDCFGIIDPPDQLTVKEIVQWHNGVHPLNTTKFTSNHVALYYPWLGYRDTTNGIDVRIPPSGGVLQAFVNSDNLIGPWAAAAGLTRGIIDGTSGPLTKASKPDQDSMQGNYNAVNPIITDRSSGNVVIFGNKTLQRLPTALDRSSVRRMLFYAVKKISDRIRHVLFDPHDDKLRAAIVQYAEETLSDVKAKRGINDYIIKCDEENNTPDTIDRNEVHCEIGIQPMHNAEFAYLTFSLHRTGSFTENT